jgi:hypothetical protein
MRFIKQLKLLTFHIILFSFFFIQNSFSKDLDKWNDGPYVGLTLVFNSIEQGDANYINTADQTNIFNYDSDREKSKGIKIGYNKMLTDSIFIGPEFFYSGEKSLDFNDSANGGVIDNIRFKRNYNVGLKAGYAVSNQIAYIIGYGKSYQRVETSHVNTLSGADTNHQIDNLSGKYRNYGIMFNLGSGYNLEFLIQRNSFDSNISKAISVDGRNAHDIKIKDVKTNSLTISKFF